MAERTVLIAAHDGLFAAALANRCQSRGWEATVCEDGLLVHQAVERAAPDLLILEVGGAGANGLALYEQLLHDENITPIPAIAVVAHADQPTKTHCDRLGVHCVWRGLEVWSELEPLIQKALDIAPSGGAAEESTTADSEDCAAVSPSQHAPKVLVVDDDPDVSKAIQLRLRAFGVDVHRAFSGMQGYWTALKERPDVVVMDFRMPEGYGNYLLGKLRSHSLTRDIPVVVLTGQCIGNSKDFALERELLSLGASAFLTKPLDFDCLKAELRQHINLTESGATGTRGSCAQVTRSG